MAEENIIEMRKQSILDATNTLNVLEKAVQRNERELWSKKTKEQQESDLKYQSEGFSLVKKALYNATQTQYEVESGMISDGYHTMNDLYYHRTVLFAALVNTYKYNSWKSRRHEDGQLCFGGGWFLVCIETPEGPYSYHCEDKYWDMFNCLEREVAKPFDGHTPEDVTRLLSLNIDGE